LTIFETKLMAAAHKRRVATTGTDGRVYYFWKNLLVLRHPR